MKRHHLIIASIQLSKAMNPYPFDVFTALTESDLKEIQQMFKDNDLNLDAFAAHCMRRVWDNAHSSMIANIQREFGE